MEFGQSSTFIIHPKNSEDFLLLIIPRRGGSLNRYYHFIADMIFPLYLALETKGLLDSELEIYTGDYRSFDFQSITESIFQVDYRRIEELDKMPESMHFINDHFISGGFFPRSGHFETLKDFFDKIGRFRDYVIDQIKPVASGGDLILVERKQENTDKGASRRFLKDHSILEKRISDYADSNGLTFKNVILEDLSFKEQVALFYHSRMIICQHGAGLVNCLWKFEGVVLELVSNRNNRVYETLCSHINILYTRLEFEEKQGELFIDPDMILTTIDRLIQIE
jgi:hypothetical protein